MGSRKAERSSATLRQRQDFGFAVCDSEGVLEVGGETAVEGADGPIVGVAFGAPVADVDHGLDRDDHAGPQDGAGVGRAVVRDLRVLVHVAADAVPDVLADDGEALAFDPGLDGGADLADAGGAARGRNAPPEGLAGYLDELLGLRRQSSGTEGDGHVGDESFVGAADVDAHDIAVRYLAVAGNAVDDLVVHRDADCGRVGRLPVLEEGGDDAALFELAAGGLVDALPHYPRPHLAFALIHRVGQDPPRLPHQAELPRPVTAYQ